MHNQQQRPKDETEIKFFIIENVTVILSLAENAGSVFQITFQGISLILGKDNKLVRCQWSSCGCHSETMAISFLRTLSKFCAFCLNEIAIFVFYDWHVLINFQGSRRGTLSISPMPHFPYSFSAPSCRMRESWHVFSSVSWSECVSDCVFGCVHVFVFVCECHIDDGCKLTHTNFVVHWANYQICSMRIYLSRGVNRRPLLGIECQSVVNEMLGMTRGRAWRQESQVEGAAST